jgi:hypothetical protein
MDDELDIMELELELLPDMLELELLSSWMRSTVTVPAHRHHPLLFAQAYVTYQAGQLAKALDIYPAVSASNKPTIVANANLAPLAQPTTQ